MVTLVHADWVEGQLDSPSVLLLDPRSPLKYLQGHLKNAVNIPIRGAFDGAMNLRSERELAQWVGAAGLDHERLPVVYDGYDGQSGSMLVWMLEYLGCTDVRLMNLFFDRWIKEGREVFYRPVRPVARNFQAKLNTELRAGLESLRTNSHFKLIDFRSREEYTGALDSEGKPGHIPNAANIVWKDLLEQEGFLAPREKLEKLMAASNIRPGDKLVAYCRSGMRAAVGFLAFRQLGFDIRLYDGSYAEWARSGLPIEL